MSRIVRKTGRPKAGKSLNQEIGNAESLEVRKSDDGRELEVFGELWIWNCFDEFGFGTL